jgi:hypothetical protein
VTTTFQETPPLPTYLVAFVAGKFSVETAQRDGRVLRIFHRETDAAKVARNRDALFDLHAKSLDWLEDYTDIRYPWGKFDVVLIPSFQFGGMEHAGAILYNAASLMLDESATQNQLLERASVIAHETSHMWFGDLVTMRWFNDVWMKEVFANFMAAKIVNPSFPQVNHELRFLLAHYPSAYQVDRTAGDERDPAGARQSRRSRPDVRTDHLPEGADRHAAARADCRRAPLSRWASRVSEALRLRECDVARSGAHHRRPDAREHRRLEPRLGRRSRPAGVHDRSADR